MGVWIAEYKNGCIVQNGKLNKEGLVKFTLLINDFKYEIRLDDSKELVYFKRVVCRFPNIVEKILYCLGYREGKVENVIWIDGITGKIV